MSMKRRKTEDAQELFIPHDALSAPGNPFYQKLEKLLREHKFDEFVEAQCEPFYARTGRPSIPPGVYFRLLLIGYFEGIGSERGICWRVQDSLSLREFIGVGLSGKVPEHSSLTRIRQRLDLGVYSAVFNWILTVLKGNRLLKGKRLGVDSTTLEANAAMRSITRKVDDRSYNEYLKGLARAEGEDDPGPKDIGRMDRKRKKKMANAEWENRNDPDAEISRMKNRTTRMAHKVEHAVDMETGAIAAIEVYGGAQGDSRTLDKTLSSAGSHLGELPQEVVADAGYHSNEVLIGLSADGIRSYISEPRRGRRNWKGKPAAKQAVYGNRQRNRRAKGKALQRARGEKLERPFQLLYDRCDLRQLKLRGAENIHKRLLMQGLGYNLGLLLLKVFGSGTPKGLAEGLKGILRLLFSISSPISVSEVANRFRIRTLDRKICFQLNEIFRGPLEDVLRIRAISTAS